MKLYALLPLIVLAFLPSMTSAEGRHSSFYRISLEDNRPILQISQQLRIELLDYPQDRQYIYLEHKTTESIHRLKLMPSHVKVGYRVGFYGTDADEYSLEFMPGTTGIDVSQDEIGNVAYEVTSPQVEFSVLSNLDNLKNNSIVTSETTFQSPDKKVTIEFNADSTTEKVDLFVKEKLILPRNPGLARVSYAYQLRIDNPESVDTSIPIKLKIQYNNVSNESKSIYSYDRTLKKWIPLQSYNDVEEFFVTAEYSSHEAFVAVFSNPTSEDGIASWYAYKDCDCAASRDYPKGSKVLVTRLKTGKQVVVTINDYGPEEWTGRLIDLDATAFEQIGSLGAGLIYVEVAPYD